MSKNNKKTPGVFMQHYAVGKSFAMISLNIFTHPAYLALSDKQRLILLQMLGHISKKTVSDPDGLLRDGFSYTWKMCGEHCSENTFSEAMKAFIRIGWIEWHANDQLLYTWQRNVYRVSAKWRNYTLGDTENAEYTAKCRAKNKRLTKKKNSKSTLLEKFFTPNG